MAARPDPAEVPCGGCTGCCKSKRMFANLDKAELERFPEAVYEASIDGMVLPKHEDGTCTKLVDGKCTIYDRRPRACRVYDCRFHLIIGMISEDDPAMEEALRGWAPLAMPTSEDMDMAIAAKMAVFDGGMPGGVKEGLKKFFTVYWSPRWQELMRAAAEMRHMINAMPKDARRELADKIQKFAETKVRK
jgi:Fe-S-cluster containining protein